MLEELTIRDFAIVDELTINWHPGLNVLTGETGAGKSIIVDAIGALLGDRLGPEVIRSGRERAFVEGIFQLPAGAPGAMSVEEVLAEQDLSAADGQLILRREVARAGRSVARINGRAVLLSTLQQVGERLVDVHGQSQHLSLLRVREHLEFLDRFAGLIARRRQVGELVAAWRAVQLERRRLQEEVRAAARERDLLHHEIAEIEAANFQLGEEQELKDLRERLRNLERLRTSVQTALLALQGEDEQRGALDLLDQAGAECLTASRADRGLARLAESLAQLSADADDVCRDLRRYLDSLDADPRQIENVEARFLALADLKRKYGDNLEAILDYLERARARLSTAERGEELLGELAERERTIRADLVQLAVELSARRHQAVHEIVDAIQGELQELGMPGGRFGVSIEQRPDPDGIAWPSEAAGPDLVAVDSTGADRVEFLFSANPGEEPRGLGRIASGGELARVALALKAVLARADERSALIFDEIDVGVGGRSAAVVGQKLWELTRSHQVLCITHLPQVAAFADHHLVVAKRLGAGATSTDLQTVTGAARLAELSAMLGGNPGSKPALANARELLSQSQSWKQARLGTRRVS